MSCKRLRKDEKNRTGYTTRKKSMNKVGIDPAKNQIELSTSATMQV